MWNSYLMLALDIAAQRQRESERQGRLRELRQAVAKGPRPMTRRRLERDDSGR
jgi:hypothetical protein